MDNLQLENTLVPWVGRTGKMILIHLNQKLSEMGYNLTGKQWILLKILHAKDGRPQHELADVTARDKASLVRLINNMEKRALVKRIQDLNDKRINRIFLSDKGKQVYSESLPVIASLFAQVQEDITPEEIDQVIDIMKRVQQNINRSHLVLKNYDH